MSLQLELGSSKGLEVKTNALDPIIYLRTQLDKAEMSMHDFVHFVRYVMTNTDLEGEKDPRLKLIEAFLGYRIVEGYSPDAKRIEMFIQPDKDAKTKP